MNCQHLASTKIIIESFDVILAKIISGLGFDEDEFF